MDRLAAALAAMDARPVTDGPTGEAAAGEQEAIAAWEYVSLSSASAVTGSPVMSRLTSAPGARSRHAGLAPRLRSRWERVGSQRRKGALAALAERERAAGDERDAVAGELAAAASREAQARDELEALLADDRAERTRLAEAERDAMAARERLRSADDRARASDVAALEARLNFDSLARAAAGGARGPW